MNDIKANLELIRQKINKASEIYQNSQKINLVAVSKTITVPEIEKAINCDCHIFGENRIIEAKNKWVELKLKYPNIKLHLIGHLQSNKSKDAVKLFDVIETLDSEKLAATLAAEINKQGKNPEIFVQINIGEESQKSGIKPEEAESFIKLAIEKYKLKVTGVMAIPPKNEDPSLYFALLTNIARHNNLKKISMGMSSDYETAITMGANYVRIGSAIFGERKLQSQVNRQPL